MSNFSKKIILIIILILGVYIMPSNFFGNITENIIDHIKYRGTLVTGEITADNGDGTYNVKINNASNAYKNVETVTYEVMFSIGEIVVIGYEYGCKESPKILGHAKKIPQEPYQSEVDYSGGCAGVQEKTVTVYSDLADGWIPSNLEANYQTAHDGITYPPQLGGDDINIGQLFDATYYITKGYLFFDTSIIPINAKITSAILSIFVAGDLSETDFYIVIQDGQPNYPHSPLQGIDYNRIHYINNGGQVSTVGISTIAYTNIPLNSNGKNWVNQGGMTKFCLRSSREIAGIVPTGNEWIAMWASEKGGNYRPKLTITYTI